MAGKANEDFVVRTVSIQEVLDNNVYYKSKISAQTFVESTLI